MRSGRTTRMLQNAISSFCAGKDTLVVAYNYAHARQFSNTIEDQLREQKANYIRKERTKFESPDTNQTRLHVCTPSTRLLGQVWMEIFVDHYVNERQTNNHANKEKQMTTKSSLKENLAKLMKKVEEKKPTTFQDARWRIMEEFENIAEHAPQDPGNSISKLYKKHLIKAGLVKTNKKGDTILTKKGEQLWDLWSKIDMNLW